MYKHSVGISEQGGCPSAHCAIRDLGLSSYNRMNEKKEKMLRVLMEIFSKNRNSAHTGREESLDDRYIHTLLKPFFEGRECGNSVYVRKARERARFSSSCFQGSHDVDLPREVLTDIWLMGVRTTTFFPPL